ncbi:MAG TPA: hypothetical protein VFR69_07870 [Rubrobacteraceae bacterium]|nr:hypothetical protein [Rubrobacteraceae bacterium]
MRATGAHNSDDTAKEVVSGVELALVAEEDHVRERESSPRLEDAKRLLDLAPGAWYAPHNVSTDVGVYAWPKIAAT